MRSACCCSRPAARTARPNIKIPAAFANQFHTKLDWDFATEPEPHVDGRSLYIPRGKSLGGSSSMNAMLYVRGRPLDYDRVGGPGRRPGWGWHDVLPYFMRSEDNARGASEYHGAGGPLRVSEQRSPRPLDQRLIEASEAAAGIPRDRRLQRPRAGRRRRCSRSPSATGGAGAPPTRFLRPALKRPEPRGAHRRDGARRRARRRRARSACAAATGSARRATRARRARGDPGRRRDRLAAAPAALGDRRAGRAARGRRAVAPRAARAWAQPPGPPVRDDASGRSPTRTTLYGADKPKALAEWVLRRTGPLSSTVAEVVAFVRTRGRACPPPTSSSTWAPPTSRTTARRRTTGTAW